MVTASQSDWGVSTEAARLHRQAIVWDMHGCMPLRPDADLGEIARYARAGASFVSLNVGFDLVPWSEAVKIAAHFRAWVLANPERYLLADTAADVRRAKREGKLAVAFDLEGARALDGQISMIAAFYRLGVRSMVLAYNANNENSTYAERYESVTTAIMALSLEEWWDEPTSFYLIESSKNSKGVANAIDRGSTFDSSVDLLLVINLSGKAYFPLGKVTDDALHNLMKKR